MGLEPLLSLPLNEVKVFALDLLRNDQTQLDASLKLVERLQNGVDSEEPQIRSLLRLLTGHSKCHPRLTEKLVELLYIYDHPVILINVMAQLCGDTEKEVEQVVEAYKELLEGDRSLLVPIIGSLSDFTLCAELRDETIELTKASLRVVEEEDVPTLIRTLLRNITTSNGMDIVAAIRRECRCLSASSDLIVLEVIGTALRMNGSAQRAFLQAISQSKTLLFLDFALLMLLLDRPRDAQVAARSLVRALESGAVPLKLILSFCDRLRVPEWQVLLPAFVSFCQLLPHVATRSKFDLPGMGATLLSWCREVYYALFVHHSGVRSRILSVLLSFCFSSGPPTTHKSNTRGSRTSVNTPVVGSGKSHVLLSTWIPRQSKSVVSYPPPDDREISLVCADVLVAIARWNPSALVSYAHVIVEHTNAALGKSTPLANMIGRDSMSSTGRAVDFGVLHRVCHALAWLCHTERGLQSVLMVSIQKQMFVKELNFFNPLSAICSGSSSFRTSSVRPESESSPLMPSTMGCNGLQLCAFVMTSQLLRCAAVDEADADRLASWALTLLPMTGVEAATVIYDILFTCVRANGRWCWSSLSSAAFAQKVLVRLHEDFERIGMSESSAYSSRNPNSLQAMEGESRSGAPSIKRSQHGSSESSENRKRERVRSSSRRRGQTGDMNKDMLQSRWRRTTEKGYAFGHREKMFAAEYYRLGGDMRLGSGHSWVEGRHADAGHVEASASETEGLIQHTERRPCSVAEHNLFSALEAQLQRVHGKSRSSDPSVRQQHARDWQRVVEKDLSGRSLSLDKYLLDHHTFAPPPWWSEGKDREKNSPNHSKNARGTRASGRSDGREQQSERRAGAGRSVPKSTSGRNAARAAQFSRRVSRAVDTDTQRHCRVTARAFFSSTLRFRSSLYAYFAAQVRLYLGMFEKAETESWRRRHSTHDSWDSAGASRGKCRSEKGRNRKFDLNSPAETWNSDGFDRSSPTSPAASTTLETLWQRVEALETVLLPCVADGFAMPNFVYERNSHSEMRECPEEKREHSACSSTLHESELYRPSSTAGAANEEIGSVCPTLPRQVEKLAHWSLVCGDAASAEHSQRLSQAQRLSDSHPSHLLEMAIASVYAVELATVMGNMFYDMLKELPNVCMSFISQSDKRADPKHKKFEGSRAGSDTESEEDGGDFEIDQKIFFAQSKGGRERRRFADKTDEAQIDPRLDESSCRGNASPQAQNPHATAPPEPERTQISADRESALLLLSKFGVYARHFVEVAAHANEVGVKVLAALESQLQAAEKEARRWSTPSKTAAEGSKVRKRASCIQTDRSNAEDDTHAAFSRAEVYANRSKEESYSAGRLRSKKRAREEALADGTGAHAMPERLSILSENRSWWLTSIGCVKKALTAAPACSNDEEHLGARFASALLSFVFAEMPRMEFPLPLSAHAFLRPSIRRRSKQEQGKRQRDEQCVRLRSSSKSANFDSSMVTEPSLTVGHHGGAHTHARLRAHRSRMREAAHARNTPTEEERHCYTVSCLLRETSGDASKVVDRGTKALQQSVGLWKNHSQLRGLSDRGGPEAGVREMDISLNRAMRLRAFVARNVIFASLPVLLDGCGDEYNLLKPSAAAGSSSSPFCSTSFPSSISPASSQSLPSSMSPPFAQPGSQQAPTTILSSLLEAGEGESYESFALPPYFVYNTSYSPSSLYATTPLNLPVPSGVVSDVQYPRNIQREVCFDGRVDTSSGSIRDFGDAERHRANSTGPSSRSSSQTHTSGSTIAKESDSGGLGNEVESLDGDKPNLSSKRVFFVGPEMLQRIATESLELCIWVNIGRKMPISTDAGVDMHRNDARAMRNENFVEKQTLGRHTVDTRLPSQRMSLRSNSFDRVSEGAQLRRSGVFEEKKQGAYALPGGEESHHDDQQQQHHHHHDHHQVSLSAEERETLRVSAGETLALTYSTIIHILFTWLRTHKTLTRKANRCDSMREKMSNALESSIYRIQTAIFAMSGANCSVRRCSNSVREHCAPPGIRQRGKGRMAVSSHETREVRAKGNWTKAGKISVERYVWTRESLSLLQEWFKIQLKMTEEATLSCLLLEVLTSLVLVEREVCKASPPAHLFSPRSLDVLEHGVRRDRKERVDRLGIFAEVSDGRHLGQRSGEPKVRKNQRTYRLVAAEGNEHSSDHETLISNRGAGNDGGPREDRTQRNIGRALDGEGGETLRGLVRLLVNQLYCLYPDCSLSARLLQLLPSPPLCFATLPFQIVLGAGKTLPAASAGATLDLALSDMASASLSMTSTPSTGQETSVIRGSAAASSVSPNTSTTASSLIFSNVSSSNFGQLSTAAPLYQLSLAALSSDNPSENALRYLFLSLWALLPGARSATALSRLSVFAGDLLYGLEGPTNDAFSESKQQHKEKSSLADSKEMRATTSHTSSFAEESGKAESNGCAGLKKERVRVHDPEPGMLEHPELHLLTVWSFPLFSKLLFHCALANLLRILPREAVSPRAKAAWKRRSTAIGPPICFSYSSGATSPTSSLHCSSSSSASYSYFASSFPPSSSTHFSPLFSLCYPSLSVAKLSLDLCPYYDFVHTFWLFRRILRLQLRAAQLSIIKWSDIVALLDHCRPALSAIRQRLQFCIDWRAERGSARSRKRRHRGSGQNASEEEDEEGENLHEGGEEEDQIGSSSEEEEPGPADEDGGCLSDWDCYEPIEDPSHESEIGKDDGETFSKHGSTPEHTSDSHKEIHRAKARYRATDIEPSANHSNRWSADLEDDSVLDPGHVSHLWPLLLQAWLTMSYVKTFGDDVRTLLMDSVAQEPPSLDGTSGVLDRRHRGTEASAALEDGLWGAEARARVPSTKRHAHKKQRTKDGGALSDESSEHGGRNNEDEDDELRGRAKKSEASMSDAHGKQSERQRPGHRKNKHNAESEAVREHSIFSESDDEWLPTMASASDNSDDEEWLVDQGNKQKRGPKSGAKTRNRKTNTSSAKAASGRQKRKGGSQGRKEKEAGRKHSQQKEPPQVSVYLSRALSILPKLTLEAEHAKDFIEQTLTAYQLSVPSADVIDLECFWREEKERDCAAEKEREDARRKKRRRREKESWIKNVEMDYARSDSAWEETGESESDDHDDDDDDDELDEHDEKEEEEDGEEKEERMQQRLHQERQQRQEHRLLKKSQGRKKEIRTLQRSGEMNVTVSSTQGNIAHASSPSHDGVYARKKRLEYPHQPKPFSRNAVSSSSPPSSSSSSSSSISSSRMSSSPPSNPSTASEIPVSVSFSDNLLASPLTTSSETSLATPLNNRSKKRRRVATLLVSPTAETYTTNKENEFSAHNKDLTTTDKRQDKNMDLKSESEAEYKNSKEIAAGDVAGGVTVNFYTTSDAKLNLEAKERRKEESIVKSRRNAADPSKDIDVILSGSETESDEETAGAEFEDSDDEDYVDDAEEEEDAEGGEEAEEEEEEEDGEEGIGAEEEEETLESESWSEDEEGDSD